MNGSYSFRAIIENEKPEGFHGFVPLLPGLHTYGDTLEEVRNNLKEATICHVQGLAKDGERIPQESEAFELIETFSARELSLA